MLYAITVDKFADWRQQARMLLHHAILPAHVTWFDSHSAQATLQFDHDLSPPPSDKVPLSIPKEFLTLAEQVACHRDPVKWDKLYQAVWRLTHGEKHLLQLTTDSLVRDLHILYKNIRRDAHKMKAFVRFRLAQDDQGDHYIAWHQSDHFVVRLTAPFFQRRFSVMRWTIMTPDETAHWDGQTLSYGPGVPASAAPTEDTWEEMWKTFYGAIFNPARIKTDMMKREMPVRYWHTMPETQLIPQLLKDAPNRVATMVQHQEGLALSASHFMPATRDYTALSTAAQACQACPLHCHARQTVFGTGPTTAALMIVGEQPGEQEDHSGQPFVGPAGQLLDQILAQQGFSRQAIYITNAVKHFKHTIDHSGPKPRIIHHAPTVREITACKPWLAAEMQLIKPRVILALGVTAGRALLGHGFTQKTQRGVWHDVTLDGHACRVLPAYHPAAILRMPDAGQKQMMYQALQTDISAAWRAAHDLSPSELLPQGR